MGSEMCIRDRATASTVTSQPTPQATAVASLPGLNTSAAPDAVTAIQAMVTQAQAENTASDSPLQTFVMGLTATQLAGKALSTSPSGASALNSNNQTAEQPLELPMAMGQGLTMLNLRKTLAESKATTRVTSEQPFNPQPGVQWKESELDLSAALPTDSKTALPDSDVSTSALLTTDSPSAKDMPTPATPQPAGNASAKTDPTGGQSVTHRLASDQMQQLSEKMADAIGERMMREIERGHWNLRLMLKPAHLGHIEVEMRLHAGGLEASFTTPQAATKELLQDGLDQLRSKLNEMGMDIANLDVKTGQNRQNGGDPTPGQQASSGDASPRDSAEQPVQTTGLSSRPRRADGWDVMV